MNRRYTDDELLPISALQHLLFCERQCALIHVERAWADNRLTVEGEHLHERVHGDEGLDVRGDLRVVRGLILKSFRLGVFGVADVVEFQAADPADVHMGTVRVSGWSGQWRALPVEYKRGKPKPDLCDSVQLAAQAICLEEMLGGTVPEGALFYASLRRRTPVILDAALRAMVEAAALRLHALVSSGSTPPAQYAKKCGNCSLRELCMPQLHVRHGSVFDYVAGIIEGNDSLTPENPQCASTETRCLSQRKARTSEKRTRRSPSGSTEN